MFAQLMPEKQQMKEQLVQIIYNVVSITCDCYEVSHLGTFAVKQKHLNAEHSLQLHVMVVS
jgi:hypothetical protein